MKGYQLRLQGYRAAGIKGCGMWCYRMWEYGAVGCEDVRIRAACMQDEGKQGCGTQRYRAEGYTAAGMQDMGIQAAGCGMHDCRMRDVGTREAGYG